MGPAVSSCITEVEILDLRSLLLRTTSRVGGPVWDHWLLQCGFKHHGTPFTSHVDGHQAIRVVTHRPVSKVVNLQLLCQRIGKGLDFSGG